MTFKRKKRPKKQRSPLLADLLYLLRKLLLIAVVLASLYVFLFGLVRYQGTDMKPAIKDGDLVAYYRLDKSYQVGDLLAYGYKEQDLYRAGGGEWRRCRGHHGQRSPC